jgi:uncharacterized protein YqfA (UPF0365 family)
VEHNGNALANRLHGDRTVRNRINGRGGADRITGGGLKDTVVAGPGDDAIRTVGDRKRDLVICGTGRDRVVADRADEIGTDCERVRYPR